MHAWCCRALPCINVLRTSHGQELHKCLFDRGQRRRLQSSTALGQAAAQCCQVPLSHCLVSSKCGRSEVCHKLVDAGAQHAQRAQVAGRSLSHGARLWVGVCVRICMCGGVCMCVWWACSVWLTEAHMAVKRT